ncbi:hypothetical protein [Gordonia hankookensis]|uniref:Secreted protein n=1 Tax=Gordonia hankookensis TaxID=589403 RepID=A0ABR7W8B4_9ACTN|nr:hypothetical protein [Gordonia hankookensis]MBD1319061.1 hypothetical protein [Gordonia hankookensis]NDZ93596.1 hypothetical protein [Streptomyces sp. SID11726]NEB27380.1 hypothetical protein [Streptomyces sp. SID6673]
MTFLFALIGIAAIGFLLWRAFGPQLADRDDHDDRPTRPIGPVGPDDDPDFLLDLDRRTRGPNGSDADDA